MHIPHEGVISIALIKCPRSFFTQYLYILQFNCNLGQISLSMTNNYQDMIDNNFLINMLNITSWTWTWSGLKNAWIILHSGTSLRGAFNRLAAHLYDSYEDIPEFKVSTRSTAEIIWSFDRSSSKITLDRSSSKFTFEPDPVVCNKCKKTEFKIVIVEYHIIVTAEYHLFKQLYQLRILFFTWFYPIFLKILIFTFLIYPPFFL